MLKYVLIGLILVIATFMMMNYWNSICDPN